MPQSNIPPAQFPAVPPRLLAALDERFPNRTPDLSDSDRQVWFKAGARSVVDFLKRQYDEQNEVTV
jgi:hypothetical protein